MAAIVRYGVIASPGTYHYKNHTMRKTAEELKAAASRQPSFMLILGHPPTVNDDPTVEQFIGRVDQKWNPQKQRVDAAFHFYDEHFDKIPLALQKKIINLEPLAISPGITVDDPKGDQQDNILYNHLAILQEGEDPTCPLGTCGVNIRRESGEMTKKIYEQKTEFSETDATAKDVETTDAVKEPDQAALLDQALARIAELEKSTTEDREIKEVETTTETKPDPVEITPVKESPAIPEQTIPQGLAPTPPRKHRWKVSGREVEITPKVRESVG